MGPEDRLVVIIEMKRLKGMYIMDPYEARAKGHALALKAVNQSIEKGYAQAYEEWPRRMDIGMAIGKGMVMETRHRWWTWDPIKKDEHCKPSIDTFRHKGESTKDWVQRVDAADTTEWRDGLGWVRTRSLSELSKAKPVAHDANEQVAHGADEQVVPDANKS
ncbi:hypothetical protein H4R19_006886 [Coemansia spiralis]|nr:hypothetical protein H4R19_006886 [Coemansia spiralis]